MQLLSLYQQNARLEDVYKKKEKKLFQCVILMYECVMVHEPGLSEARQRLSMTPQFSPGFTPSGTPKILSTGASPRSYSAASSPKLFSGAASPTSSHYDIRMWSSSSQQSSVANSPPRSHSTSGLQLKHF